MLHPLPPPPPDTIVTDRALGACSKPSSATAWAPHLSSPAKPCVRRKATPAPAMFVTSIMPMKPSGSRAQSTCTHPATVAANACAFVLTVLRELILGIPTPGLPRPLHAGAHQEIATVAGGSYLTLRHPQPTGYVADTLATVFWALHHTEDLEPGAGLDRKPGRRCRFHRRGGRHAGRRHLWSEYHSRSLLYPLAGAERSPSSAPGSSGGELLRPSASVRLVRAPPHHRSRRLPTAGRPRPPAPWPTCPGNRW